MFDVTNSTNSYQKYYEYPFFNSNSRQYNVSYAESLQFTMYCKLYSFFMLITVFISQNVVK